MSDHTSIETSAEVYAVIMARHRDLLKGFGSYSAPEGSELNPDVGIMKTEWGFPGQDFPTLGILTTWDIVDGKEKEGTRKHKYWLCVGKAEY